MRTGLTQRRFPCVVLVVSVALTMAACEDSLVGEDTLVACQDGVDNDKNGLTDCKDPACAKQSICDPSVTKSCGDGVVTDPERCDTKIPAGQTGACPTSCDDGNACTKDSLGNPGTCVAACVAIPVTDCVGGDGCCPTGCDASKDSDCSASCGNGVVEPKEACDTKIAAGQPGACPTSCDDGNACTIDALLNGGTCGATCGHQPMIVCLADKSDGCCPTGCNATTDLDCSPTCGNGVLEPKENCDTKIAAGQPGACPSSCDDKLACTSDVLLNGGTCATTCTNQPITGCSGQKVDGCCPTGCDAVSDVDCSPTCGNGVLEPKENCDTTIVAGQPGACPTSTSCSDQDSCTIDTVLDAATCSATCSNVKITQCKDGDGCCLIACNAGTDNDCKAVCGNGALEPGEACDTSIPAGQTGACPTSTSCTDQDSCTVDAFSGAGTCGATCIHTPIATCQDGDGCCPPTCNSLVDNDCKPTCGNGVVEFHETCDTKIPAGQLGACVTSCNSTACAPSTLFNAGTCEATCMTSPITICSGGNIDGCCPAGCYCGSPRGMLPRTTGLGYDDDCCGPNT